MMKYINAVITFGLTLLTLAASANAQSPREQLQQMVEQLQKTPTDATLRGRIITLGSEIKPAPAIPEEARRSFVEGVTIVKVAKEMGSQKLAIKSFDEALRIAPWWGDAYYNLAVTQELTGQLDEAERTLKLFLLSNPSESDARDAQDRVYAIAARRKLAAVEERAKQEKANSPQARAEALVAILRSQYRGSVTKLMICGEKLNQYWTCTESEARGSNWYDDYLARPEAPYMYQPNPVAFEVVDAGAGKIRMSLGKRSLACGVANGTDPNSVAWVFCEGPAAGQSYGTFHFTSSSPGKAVIKWVYPCEDKEKGCRRENFYFN